MDHQVPTPWGSLQDAPGHQGLASFPARYVRSSSCTCCLYPMASVGGARARMNQHGASLQGTSKDSVRPMTKSPAVSKLSPATHVQRNAVRVRLLGLSHARRVPHTLPRSCVLGSVFESSTLIFTQLCAEITLRDSTHMATQSSAGATTPRLCYQHIPSSPAGNGQPRASCFC